MKEKIEEFKDMLKENPKMKIFVGIGVFVLIAIIGLVIVKGVINNKSRSAYEKLTAGYDRVYTVDEYNKMLESGEIRSPRGEADEIRGGVDELILKPKKEEPAIEPVAEDVSANEEVVEEKPSNPMLSRLSENEWFKELLVDNADYKMLSTERVLTSDMFKDGVVTDVDTGVETAYGLTYIKGLVSETDAENKKKIDTYCMLNAVEYDTLTAEEKDKLNDTLGLIPLSDKITLDVVIEYMGEPTVVEWSVSEEGKETVKLVYTGEKGESAKISFTDFILTDFIEDNTVIYSQGEE